MEDLCSFAKVPANLLNSQDRANVLAAETSQKGVIVMVRELLSTIYTTNITDAQFLGACWGSIAQLAKEAEAHTLGIALEFHDRARILMGEITEEALEEERKDRHAQRMTEALAGLSRLIGADSEGDPRSMTHI